MVTPEVRDAATVMLVRDGADGMEVFMLRRSLNSDFVGGAYVFPGGAVDDADRHADLESICRGRTDAEASEQLGVETGGLAFWVAAVRECFEEAGVLLACSRGSDEAISFLDPDIAARFAAHRRVIDGGHRRLIEVCREEDLEIAAGEIHYFSHWITPVGPPRRYDTRFFVAAAPSEQEPLHDDRETIANLWVRPHDALALHRAGELDLIFPTIKNLEAIGRFTTSAELLEAARSISVVPAMLPRIVDDEGGMRILLPGDPGYDDAMGALPEGVPLPGRPGGPQRGER